MNVLHFTFLYFYTNNYQQYLRVTKERTVINQTCSLFLNQFLYKLNMSKL